MALDLGSLTRTAMLSQNTQASQKRTGSPVDSFDAANRRVQQQLDSTSVKLSSFSKIQSGFADVQATAKALSDPKKTGTPDDVTKAAQAFAAAFNNATVAANAAVKGDGKQAGALADDGRAGIAASDLRSIASANRADLKKIGMSIKTDGTISVDATALQNAIKSDAGGVKDALARLGKFADRVATKELSASGNVGGSVNALSSQSKGLEARLAEQQRAATAFQDSVQKGTSAINATAAAGISSYLQNLAL